MKRFCLALIVIMVALVTLNTDAYAGKVSQLIWDPPTHNVDDTVVDDLAKFKFYCSTNPADIVEGADMTGNTAPVELDNVPADKTSELLSNIFSLQLDGTYSCAISAFDFSGNQSVLSNTVEVRKFNGNFFVDDTVAPKGMGSLGTN